MRHILACILLVLTACGGAPEASAPVPTNPPSCPDEAAEFIRLSKSLMQEWQDAVKLAESTPRASLSPQIAELQRIRRETDALEVPACAAAAKQHLVAAMDAGIEGFLAFLGQKRDSHVTAQFKTASNELMAYQSELAAMSGLAPVQTNDADRVETVIRVGGSAQSAQVRWTKATGARAEETVQLPWTETAARVVGQQVELFVESNGSLWCEVRVRGELIWKETAQDTLDCMVSVTP